jgi:redox-sensitive bicupin YhaK (pirin superfamily)
MTVRHVRHIHDAYRDDIADLSTMRPLPGPDIQQIDPFIFLNHHGPQTYSPRNHGLPFGPHPHRGFETVTFILEGSLAHLDSGGGESVIREGGVQWMTAGSGLVHAEISDADFKRTGGPLEILQLWVNLPSRLKMTKPRYVGVQSNEIPVISTDSGKVAVHLVSGEFEGQRGPIESLTGVFMSWVDIKVGGRFTAPAPKAENIFLYVVRGEVKVAGTPVRAFQLLEMNDDGDSVEVGATKDALVLFGHAVPFKEPVVAHGPFVMNTRAEIQQAMQDYQAGKFGDVRL